MNKTASTAKTLDLGTFEGYRAGAIRACLRNLSAADVIKWDIPQGRQFEFRPATDDRLVSALFAGPVEPSDLRLLVDLLPQLDADREESLLWIQFVVHGLGHPIWKLNMPLLRRNRPELFYGHTDEQAAKGAAMDLFERENSTLFEAFMEDTAEILTFDWQNYLKRSGMQTYHAIVNRDSRSTFMVLTGYYFPEGVMTENPFE